MVYMEISVLLKDSLKIRGKQATIVVNPKDKLTDYNAAIMLEEQDAGVHKLSGESVVIQGPGEYEVAGIKINGTKESGETVYTLIVDDIEILIGKLSSFAKVQHKLKEAAVVVVDADSVVDSSFITSLATGALVFYGEQAEVVTKSISKENLKQMSKYQITKDKLPSEPEAIMLASSS